MIPPEVVASRAANISGDELMQPNRTPGAQFAVLDNKKADTAIIEAIPNRVFTPIGYYEPGERAWLFFDEYASRDEHAELTGAMENIASAALLDLISGGPFPDVRHEMTTEARQRMNEAIKRLGLIDKLTTRQPVNAWGMERYADHFTTGRFALRQARDPRFYEFVFVFQGLQLHDPDNNVSLRNIDGERSSESIVLATRPADTCVWMPVFGYIGSDEWDGIVPPMLDMFSELSNRDPDFSTYHAAVMRTGIAS